MATSHYPFTIYGGKISNVKPTVINEVTEFCRFSAIVVREAIPNRLSVQIYTAHGVHSSFKYFFMSLTHRMTTLKYIFIRDVGKYKIALAKRERRSAVYGIMRKGNGKS